MVVSSNKGIVVHAAMLLSHDVGSIFLINDVNTRADVADDQEETFRPSC